jgi:hypothetical protein
MKTCPFCGAEIRDEAIKCKACKEDITFVCSQCAEPVKRSATKCSHCETPLTTYHLPTMARLLGRTYASAGGRESSPLRVFQVIVALIAAIWIAVILFNPPRGSHYHPKTLRTPSVLSPGLYNEREAGHYEYYPDWAKAFAWSGGVALCAAVLIVGLQLLGRGGGEKGNKPGSSG